MSTNHQIELLGLDKLNVLDKLNIILGGHFQITGSISLIEYGIHKRKVNDIDIVVNSLDELKITFNHKGYDFHEWFDYSDRMENPAGTQQERGKVTNRISFEIDGVKVCAFYGVDQEYKECHYVADRIFRVSHPKYSIEAKKKYVRDLFELYELNSFQIKKLEKHALDICEYYKVYKPEVAFPF